jgi:hypothetical protein
VLAIGLAAMGVQTQGMVGDFKALALGHFDLQCLNLFVVKFFDTPAI